MALFGRGGPPMVKYRMKERAFDIGEDYWVEDDDGRRVFKVDGKVMRIRKTFVLKDADGNDVATIREKMVSVRDKMTVDLGGRSAVVGKALIGIRERYQVKVDGGPDMKAKGNFIDHEYEIEVDGDRVATISKKWFRVRDTYGIEVAEGADVPLVIAVAVCIDELAHD
jgi:uncharacterized protein YxjI